MRSSVFSIIIFLLLLPFSLICQENVTTFGLQFKPIFVSDIGGSGPFIFRSGPLSVDVQPKTGNAYGMIIRRGITKSISVEGGINRIQRNYSYLFQDADTGYERTLDFGYVNYEIPFKSMVFVRLGEYFYLNNGLGASLDLYASDVGTGNFELESITLRGAWAKVAMEAHVGLEMRTRKSGYFYLGGTYHNPFSPVARSLVSYTDASDRRTLIFDLNGGYLTMDIKYYFYEPPVR